MKANYGMDSKYRCEGRMNLPRRRVATKTCSENGDFEMELSRAIRESLKYAKENEMKLKQMEGTSPLLNGAQREEPFSCMTEKMISFASEKNEGQGHGSDEVQHLKDLLLIHIELVQQQQELLGKKDKEILTLRNEKDSLLWRLQKAEKRMSQLKQKEELLERQMADAKDLAAALDMTAPASASASEKFRPEKVDYIPNRKRRRQQPNKPAHPPKVKRYSTPSDKASETTEEHDSGTENSDSAEEESREHEQEDDEKSESSVSHKEDPRTEEEGEEMEEKSPEEPDPHPEPVLRTECLYHVSCCVEHLPEEPSDVLEDASEKDVVTGDQVEIPGWRVNVLTNRYQLEGTENITDEAYQKRHQRHELEEKRRKRWDIQRLREQRVFEKLRGKEEAATNSAVNCQAFKSFLPTMEDLTHVEISESVPIMAFGQAIPHVQPSEFELPWDGSPPIRKSHGGRARQK
ncbi:hypothetical protein ACOMHN_041907 [Nucella lapillus]